MIRGTLQADGIALMEISHISFLAGSANPKMYAKLAFIKTDTGSTLGWTEHGNWSAETLVRLSALRESMEQDVATIYMQDTSGARATIGSASTGLPQGIANYLGSEDAPSL
jgi:hypothetical protein